MSSPSDQHAPARTIRAIVLHSDLDAWLSCFLLRHFGHLHRDPYFRDVALAAPYFADAATEKIPFDREEYLLVDQLGGEFDHHEPGSPYQSAAQKVAAELRIYEEPGVGKLVDFVTLADQALLGREPLVDWARAVSWWSQDEPGRAYRLFAQLFRGILRMHRCEKRLPLEWDVDDWLGKHFPLTPKATRVLRPILRALRNTKLPAGKHTQQFAIKELAAALRYGSPHPAEFDRNFELLLYSLLEWKLEGERGEAEAEQAECIEVGGVKIAYGEYRSDRFAEWLRRKHSPQITIGVNPERQIAGVVADVGSPIELDQVAVVVRRREAELRHQRLQGELTRKGDLHGWFLHNSGNLLLCGSRHHPPKEGPSLIGLSELVELVSSTLRSKTPEQQPCGAA